MNSSPHFPQAYERAFRRCHRRLLLGLAGLLLFVGAAWLIRPELPIALLWIAFGIMLFVASSIWARAALMAVESCPHCAAHLAHSRARLWVRVIPRGGDYRCPECGEELD